MSKATDNPDKPEKVGIIAGYGDFPVIFTREIKSLGFVPVVVALEEESGDELQEVAPDLLKTGVGEFEKIVHYLKGQDVTNVVMIGKVHKDRLFSARIDESLQKVIASVGIKDDPTLLKAIGMAFHKAGLIIVDASRYLSSLLVPEGVLTTAQPSDSQMADAKYGFSVAKEIARLGIGQTVVVRDGVVLAVEAIEGTDKAISRASDFSGGKGVVVKVASPNHDMRYDIPVVGSNTINTLFSSGATLLAVEAGKTIILNRDDVVKRADDKGIVILAI